MIHIFNRRELTVTNSDQKLYRLREALSAADIHYHTKAHPPFAVANRYHGTPFINQDATHPCIIYVKASDYERAKTAIQSAL